MMEEVDDIFDGLGVEIELKEDDDFLKVRETLTRIGVSSRQEKKYTNLAIYCIKEADMQLCILKSCLF